MPLKNYVVNSDKLPIDRSPLLMDSGLVFRRVARIFRGGGGAYLNNRDQIINVLNDTIC